MFRRRAERRRTQALARLAAHFDAQLAAATDIAITRARRELMATWPTIPLADRLTVRGSVTVADVQEAAWEHFGLAAVPPDRAAAILRNRYEWRTGAMDLDTDAYDDQETQS
ncbi:hypothetical protein [Streptomyces sp. wa1063]|uniref:hypothetical protein n=1 Tax=Streptomyces sp. wa1063 TaxID=1828212 RepID=UPI000BEF3B2D|nr:hypothetical protein [Streptomyces sp. wa1063]